MAKSKPADPEAAVASEPGGYFHWSRMPSMGLFAVLPLWLVYVGLRWQLLPDDRNGAELWLLQEVGRLGSRAHLMMSGGFALLIVSAAVVLVRRHIPWSRVAAVIALEGIVYGVMLGPIASAMTSSANRLLHAGGTESVLLANVVGSVGAGIFEELVFRLGLMSALVWVGIRTLRGWSLPSWVAGVVAVVLSALVFSWFHHFCGEPYDRGRFVFRTMAGIVLGLLMWARGYGVCVYTHTFYNLYFYLLRPDGN
ncbi:MAG: CPBP family intramembrane metalloprotease [Planctomycetes bacterium]|nr:CPBP family intramembrane metalloprotease [Planctomycetota bacterium]